jgi:hypothetical protein
MSGKQPEHSPEAHMRERRRGERVLLRIPLKVFGFNKSNEQVSVDAETVVVSRTGALMRCREALKPGGTLEITNNFTQKSEKFRVVWTSGEAKQGFFDIGVELLNSSKNFWGINFPPPPRS